jgi:signal transduction histidine kinase
VDGGLSFTVADRGPGFDPADAHGGTGLQGMADRLAAVGGALEMRSQPGQGTVVSGRVPIGVVPDVPDGGQGGWPATQEALSAAASKSAFGA